MIGAESEDSASRAFGQPRGSGCAAMQTRGCTPGYYLAPLIGALTGGPACGTDDRFLLAEVQPKQLVIQADGLMRPASQNGRINGATAILQLQAIRLKQPPHISSSRLTNR